MLIEGGATPGTGGSLLNLQNSSGTLLATINASGNVLTSGTIVTGSSSAPSGITGQLTVLAGGGSNIGSVIRAGSSQTGDLLDLQDSSGNVNGSFNSNGSQLTLGRIAISGTTSAGKLLLGDGTTDGYSLALISGSTLTANDVITVPNSGGADSVCLKTLGNCVGSGGSISGSGTLNYIAKFNNSGGTNLGNSNLYDSGSFVGLNTTTNTGLLSIQGATSSQSSLFVQGSSSATVPVAVIKGGLTPGSGADLLDLQLNNSTVVTKFDSNGNFTNSGLVTASASGTNALDVSGTPPVSATSSLVQIGPNAIAGGNATATTGGTFLGINESLSGAGSAADFLDFENNGNHELQVTSGGAVTEAGSLTVSAGGITVSGGGLTVTGNSTIAGTLGSLTGLTSSGTITFSGLGAGVVQSSSAGVLSSGAISVSNGGTGATSFTANGVLYGNGTSAIQATVAGTPGQVLLANGTNVPTFTSLSGDVTVNSTGATAIGAGKVTNTDLVNSSITLSNGTNITGGGTVALGGTLTVGVINNPTFSGLVTLSASGTNALDVSGTPLVSATSSLVQIGPNAIAGGNATATTGGTFLGINESLSGAGSAADFLDFENNGNHELQVTSGGAVTEAGTLTVSAGGASITGGLTAGGTITFSGLGAGVVQSSSAGVLSSGAISVSNGGTGATSFTANGVLYGNGTSAIQATAAGTPGQVLLANGTNVPTFTSLSGDVTVNSTGATAIGAGKVTNTDLVNSSITLSNGTNITGGGTVALGGTLTVGVINNPTFSGLVTLSASGTNALDVSGTPLVSATSSLVQIGPNAIAGGNATATTGGTFLGINESLSGAGSAADFLDFENNGNHELQVTSGGAVTEAGTLTVSAGGAS